MKDLKSVMTKRVNQIYQFGPFRLDTAERLLLRDSQPVPLTPKAFDTLLALVERSGHLIEKDQLIERLWPDSFVEEATLARNISDLRKALGEAHSEHKYIETVSKRGYRFVAGVIELGDDADVVLEEHTRSRVIIEEEREEAQDAKSEWVAPISQAGWLGIRPRTLKRFILASAVLLAAAVLYFIWQSGAMRREPSLNPTHKQMSFTGDAIFPALSPDGKFIAYLTGEHPTRQKVMVQEVTGGQPVEIFQTRDCRDLRWSPDGSELMVSAGPETSLIPRLGGSPRRFPLAGLACWSADGSQIAVSMMSMNRIFFFDKLAGERTEINLAGTFQWLTDLDWSPTGDSLLFATLEKGTQATLWTIRPDGTHQQKILEQPDAISSPRWSRGGNVIYFLRRKDQTLELWKIPIIQATGEPEAPASVVLTGLQAGVRFAASTDGKRLLYARMLGYSNLWLGTPEGSEERQRIKTTQLTTGTSSIRSPSVSPDGKWIAFTIGGGSTSNIYKMPIEGGTPQQLTFWDSFNAAPTWSPDGTKIAFGSNQGGTARVWVISSEGGPPHQFAKSELAAPEFSRLAWTPGVSILYQRPGNRNFHLLNPGTEEERPLVTDDSVGYMFSPWYSPDGNRVAVSWNRRPRGIWVISLDGSSESLAYDVVAPYAPLGWSTDGKWIYISRLEEPQTILKIPGTGGEPRMVANLPFNNIGGLSITADGKRFVFTVHERKSDVWLVEDFDAENHSD